MDLAVADSRLSADGVVIVPALLMLVGSAALFVTRVPESVQACTQNFSAGLLISAVAGELFPLLSSPQATPLQSSISLAAGFLAGLFFMFGLAHLTESDDEAPVDKQDSMMDSFRRGFSWTRQLSGMSGSMVMPSASEAEAPLLTTPEAGAVLELVHRDAIDLQREVGRLEDGLSRACREDVDEIIHMLQYRTDKAKRRLTQPGPLDEANVARMQFHSAELRTQCEALQGEKSLHRARAGLEAFDKTLEHIHHHVHRIKFRRWQPKPEPKKDKPAPERMPYALVFAVTTDAAVDGLLIGLAYSASHSAGWCMSIATTIEMAFLGLSFSASVQHATRSLVKHAVIVAVPPLVLALAGLGGHALGNTLSESPCLFIGFISFAIVALLFLVTQELLTEAREVAGEDLTTNSMIFVGLLAGILLERLLG